MDLIEEFTEIIKNEDEDMSRQMKSHYKKQFTKMMKEEIEKNLSYKLCLKISEMNDELKLWKEDVDRLRECNQELKLENRKLKSQKI